MLRNSTRLAVGALGVAACAIAAAAVAQDKTVAAAEATASPAADGVVVTPRKSRIAAAAEGLKSASAEPDKVEGEVAWKEVREALDEMKSEEARVARETRALELSRPLSAGEREKMRPMGLRAMSAGQYKNVSPTEVRQTRVPVLAPLTADTVGALRVACRKNAFTAFGDLPNGAYFEIIGTRMRVVGGGPETIAMRQQARQGAMPRLAALDAPFEISHHEQGVDLSFSRFNVAYQISVLCENPDGDARCAGDDYVKSLADNLALLNEEEGAGQ